MYFGAGFWWDPARPEKVFLREWGGDWITAPLNGDIVAQLLKFKEEGDAQAVVRVLWSIAKDFLYEEGGVKMRR